MGVKVESYGGSLSHLLKKELTEKSLVVEIGVGGNVGTFKRIRGSGYSGPYIGIDKYWGKGSLGK